MALKYQLHAIVYRLYRKTHTLIPEIGDLTHHQSHQLDDDVTGH